MSENDSLAAALALVQSKLPDVSKTKTATVQTRAGGSYSYAYADLAAISRQVLPLLGDAGLCWLTKPTLTDDSRLVLVYALVHRSGEREEGSYPLPQSGSPQELGSAITYARRYCLCAVVGVAAEQDDDDGRAATERASRQSPPAHDQTGREPDSVVDAVQTGARLTLAIRDAATLDDLEATRLAITASLGAGRISDDKAGELVAALDARAAQLGALAEQNDTDAGPRVTRPQLNAIHTLYDQCGWSDRADKLRATSALTGRQVQSSTDLTKREAGRLIDTLQRAAEGDDPAAALTELVARGGE
jgi:hypothetical protein